MVYITVKQSPQYHQMTLEEFLFQTDTPPMLLNNNETNTRTYEVEQVSEYMARKFRFDIQYLIRKLAEFNNSTANLRSVPRHDLYKEFYIPKRSGGLRKIDAPKDELMDALRRLKTIFEQDFRILYHTSAFAYIKHRSTLSALKRHQENESRWYAKYDLHNFFGSTTLPFVLQQFSMIYPFSEVMKETEGAVQLTTALELAFLDGGLPQGTPISPLITNIMMIPIDYKLSNALRDYNGQRFVYTRYADDFQVSSRRDFSFREIEQFITDTLKEFNAPFATNREKTRYGSSSGSNWNLGLMVNKDNEITVGYKKKRQFKAMLTSFVLDTLNGNRWDLNDIQVMEGLRNYYRMIEGDKIDEILRAIGTKYHVNVLSMIRDQLK
jgi:hypothetical protein